VRRQDGYTGIYRDDLEDFVMEFWVLRIGTVRMFVSLWRSVLSETCVGATKTLRSAQDRDVYNQFRKTARLRIKHKVCIPCKQ